MSRSLPDDISEWLEGATLSRSLNRNIALAMADAGKTAFKCGPCKMIYIVLIHPVLVAELIQQRYPNLIEVRQVV